MLLTLNKICELVGKDRKTVAPRVADVPFKKGPNKSQLYESSAAFAAIYSPAKVTFDQARTELTISQKRLTDIRAEEVCRTRMPIDVVLELWDAALQAFTSKLKAGRGKKLSPALINELLTILRTVKLPLKW